MSQTPEIPEVITVTRPYFPDKYVLSKYLDGIYNSKTLTNNGPLLQDLEQFLGNFHGMNSPVVVCNGTMGLTLSLKTLEIDGDVITTPFSFIATASSIAFNNIKPIFVDIDPDTFNIDPSKIEQAITNDTQAIVATHIFGNPCDTEAILTIAKKHDLKVVFDAAHAFGVKYKGRSIFEYGDLSVLSMHATKLFHTVEGGAIFSTNKVYKKKIKILRNFGFNEEYDIKEVGINGKCSEVHSAFGLAYADDIPSILARRKEQYKLYQTLIKSKKIKFQQISCDPEEYNYAYMPIVLESEEVLLEVTEMLNKNNIEPRRYYYPSLDKMYSDSQSQFDLRVTDKLSETILCLPLYHDLSIFEIVKICNIVNEVVAVPTQILT